MGTGTFTLRANATGGIAPYIFTWIDRQSGPAVIVGAGQQARLTFGCAKLAAGFWVEVAVWDAAQNRAESRRLRLPSCRIAWPPTDTTPAAPVSPNQGPPFEIPLILGVLGGLIAYQRFRKPVAAPGTYLTRGRVR
jgi:hypothetical protein